MTTPNEPDPTMPVPTGGEATTPVPPVGDATIPLQGEPYGGGPGGPGGPTDDDYDDEEGDNRRLWLIAGSILVLGLIVGIIIALVASGGGDETASTTSTSSTSTSTSTSTTLPVTTTAPPPTTPASPQITQFTVGQSPVDCPGTTQVTLTWTTQNAESVTMSIDDPNGPFGNYGPADTEQFPFACGNNPGSVQHTYYLRANGAGGQNTQKQISVTGNYPPPSSTTSTT